MSRAVLAGLALAAVLSSSDVEAATPSGGLLIIDSSLNNIEGDLFPSGIERYAFDAHTGGGVYVPVNVPGVNAVPAGAYAAGLGLGLAAGALADAMAHSQRDKAIAEIRGPLAKGRMRAFLLDSVNRHLAVVGHPVARTVIAPEATDRIIPRAIGHDEPSEIILFDTADSPLVSLSSDDRTVVVRTEVSFEHLERGRYVRDRHLTLAYFEPAPVTDAPKAYWAADGGQHVLDAVDHGVERVLAFVASPAAASIAKLEKTSTVQAHLGDRDLSVRGSLLQRDDQHAYLLMPGEWVAIVPVAQIPENQQPPAATATLSAGAASQ